MTINMKTICKAIDDVRISSNKIYFRKAVNNNIFHFIVANY